MSPLIERNLGLAGCHVVAQIQSYHLICIWGSLVKCQGGGVVLKTTLCARLWSPEFLYRGLSLSFKARCVPQIEEGLFLGRCHVVAQTPGLSSGMI